MSSLKHQQHSTAEQYRSATQLSFPDTGAQQVPVEQLSFPEYSPVADNPHTPIPSAKTSSAELDKTKQEYTQKIAETSQQLVAVQQKYKDLEEADHKVKEEVAQLLAWSKYEDPEADGEFGKSKKKGSSE